MKSSLPVYFLMSIFLLPFSVHAESDPDSHRQKAEKLLIVTKMDENIQQGIDNMVAMQLSRNPALINKKPQLNEFFNKYIGWESFKGEIIGLYVEAFTEQELNEMIVFYSTPTGQKMIKTVPDIMVKRSKIAMQRLQQNQEQLKTLIETEASEKQVNKK